MNTLREIVHRLGAGDLYAGGTKAVVPGPGHSKRDRSLSLIEIGGRVVFHSFSGDAARDVFAYIGLEPARAMTPHERRTADQERREIERGHVAMVRAHCASVWRETVAGADTAVERYLRTRGLACAVPADLRFHPRAPMNYMRTRSAPAMVALIRDSAGAPAALHVTAIRPDGSGKAFGADSRRIFGSFSGGAVRPAPIARGAVLALAEGIETALSFSELHGLPAWAALSTGGLRTFQTPAGLSRLYIGADADEAGLGAARALAERARRACDVVIAAPASGDWNDVLRERQR